MQWKMNSHLSFHLYISQTEGDLPAQTRMEVSGLGVHERDRHGSVKQSQGPKIEPVSGDPWEMLWVFQALWRLEGGEGPQSGLGFRILGLVKGHMANSTSCPAYHQVDFAKKPM